MIAPYFTDNKYRITVKIGNISDEKILEVEAPAPKPAPKAEVFETPGFVTFRTIPHNTLENKKNDNFADVLADSYQNLFTAWRAGMLGNRERIFFESVMSTQSYETFVSSSQSAADMTRQQLNMTWKNLNVLDDTRAYMKYFTDPGKVSAYEMKLRYHFFLSLKTDRKMTEAPLPEILELSRFMSGDDRAVIQFGFQSAEEEWVKEAAAEEKNFAKKRPREWKNREVGTATQMKQMHPGYDFVLRIAVYSQDERRRRRIARGISIALKQLNGDNELLESEIGKIRIDRWLEGFRSLKLDVPFLYSKRNIITAPEAGRFLNFPQRSLQEEYPIIKAIDTKETNIDPELQKGGWLLGEAEFQGKKYPISIRADEKYWGNLCLPSVAIGGMDQGKTKGFGANALVQAVKMGFGGMAIDPAKGELGDEVERCLRPDQVERYNLANIVFGLDWNEVKHAKNGGKDMLVDTVLAFFEDNTDQTGAQTARFLEAAVHGMQTGRLSEIVRICTEKKYLKECYSKMPMTIHRTTLKELHDYQDARRAQIVAPILNRLNIVLGDSWMLKCMESRNSIDMVELLQKRKAIIFDVAKKDGLSPRKIDLIVNLLTTKIALAMQLRPEKNQFPFFIIYDEPHQFLRSTKLWEFLAVESRKWRVKFVWMFHEWDQLPAKTQKHIKAALPHYHIYPSAKSIFKDLKEEIDPFTVEEAMKLKKYHAINVLRTKNGVAQALIVRMTAPPSEQKKEGAA